MNEDLSREYQAIIAYVVYSQVLSGAQYVELEIHAKQEFDHALILSRQIDYLGKMPAVTPKPVRTSKNPKDNSKVMNWVAPDRGIWLAEKRALPGNRTKWTRARGSDGPRLRTRADRLKSISSTVPLGRMGTPISMWFASL